MPCLIEMLVSDPFDVPPPINYIYYVRLCMYVCVCERQCKCKCER